MSTSTGSPTTSETIPIVGLDCEDCARTLAHGLERVPGVVKADVSAAAGSARIAFEPDRLDRSDLIASIEAHGYRAGFQVGDAGVLVFDMLGLDCADCAMTVERSVGSLTGVEKVTVNFGAATMQVTPAGNPPESLNDAIERVVDQAGFEARRRTGGAMSRAAAPNYWRDRRFLIVLGGLLLWIAGMVAEHGLDLPRLANGLFITGLVLAGSRFVRAAWLSIRSRRIDMNVLMTISAIGAAALGDWGEAALVIVLFALGNTLQAVTLDRTRQAVRSLMDIVPPDARLVRDGVETVVAAAALHAGDLVRVRPGDKVPADGVILEGSSALDQRAITGESMPVDRSPGDELYGGSVNGSGSLVVRIERPASESTVARIIDLVASAQASKAPSELLVDRFAAWYTPLVVGVAAVLALGGALLSDNASDWVYRALVLLVIACPCALVISTPVSIVSAIGAATRRGILIKGGEPLEALGRISTVAFDKTGTLTLGKPAVTAITPFAKVSAAELLATAAAVEQLSEHPVARAVVNRARNENLIIEAASDFQATAGRGVEGTIGNRVIRIGAPDWVLGGDDLAQADDLAAAGVTPFAVAEVTASGLIPLGLIGVSDQPRPEARAAVSDLRRTGVSTIVMLTGDHRVAAQAIGDQVGVDDVRAGLLPQDKATVIADLQQRGPVAMIGDGINDAPALALADVGIAMGRGATDVALETADIALMREDLGAVAEAIGLSQRTLGIIRQNVTISFAIKALALALGVAGFVSLWIAVAADVGASLLVTLNGLRLLRGGPREHNHE
jgi:Cd2+/Zn2+-exporting ATPase